MHFFAIKHAKLATLIDDDEEVDEDEDLYKAFDTWDDEAFREAHLAKFAE